MEVENLSSDIENFTGNVWKISGSETVLVDVGTGEVWKRIRNLDSVDKVVVTHSHHDHVDNLPKVVDRFEAEVHAFEPENLPVEAEELKDGDEIELSGVAFEIYHTPGHRDDSICLYSPEKGILFTGDLIFPDAGFGRTDLEQGNRDLLIESIEKITKLDVESFYPGHGDAVTKNASEWIEKSLRQAKKREPKY